MKTADSRKKVYEVELVCAIALSFHAFLPSIFTFSVDRLVPAYVNLIYFIIGRMGKLAFFQILPYNGKSASINLSKDSFSIMILGSLGLPAYSAKTEHSLRMSGALFR